MFVNQKWIENGTICKPQGNFVYNRYVHFYNVDTILCHPIRSLRLFHSTKCLSQNISQGLQSVLSLSFIALGTPTNSRYEKQRQCFIMTEAFLLEWDRKTVRSCLLTAKQQLSKTFGTYIYNLLWDPRHINSVTTSELYESITELRLTLFWIILYKYIECKICVTQSVSHSLRELRPSWEAANSSAIQELPSNLCNPKVHYHVHKSPPLGPILTHIDQVHTTHNISLRCTLILLTNLRLGLANCLFPSGFLTNILYAFLFSPFLLHAMPISSSVTWSF
jgi:hypothetical protein